MSGPGVVLVVLIVLVVVATPLLMWGGFKAGRNRRND